MENTFENIAFKEKIIRKYCENFTEFYFRVDDRWKL